jgi:hypothetical protein
MRSRPSQLPRGRLARPRTALRLARSLSVRSQRAITGMMRRGDDPDSESGALPVDIPDDGRHPSRVASPNAGGRSVLLQVPRRALAHAALCGDQESDCRTRGRAGGRRVRVPAPPTAPRPRAGEFSGRVDARTVRYQPETTRWTVEAEWLVVDQRALAASSLSGQGRAPVARWRMVEFYTV